MQDLTVGINIAYWLLNSFTCDENIRTTMLGIKHINIGHRTDNNESKVGGHV